jgi:hypothetical protein
MEFLLLVPAPRMLGESVLAGCSKTCNFVTLLSRRKDEVMRTVKLYQKAELESVGKQENTIFG